MPKTTLGITIANGVPQPNGTAASLSKSGRNWPDRAYWRASDSDYQVSLPAAVWTAPAGESLNLTVSRGATSPEYTVKSDAPLGLQAYGILKVKSRTRKAKSTTARTKASLVDPKITQPQVMIDP